MNGKNAWYVIDGYRPPVHAGEAKGYIGHESLMILNCNDKDAHVTIDVYFSDRDPVRGIKYTACANRISAFRSDDRSVFGMELGIGVQYSLRITSDVEVVVQYGRMDISQPNLSYLATLGYGE